MDREFILILLVIALTGVLLAWAGEKEDAFRDECKAQGAVVLKTGYYRIDCIRIPGAEVLNLDKK